MSIMARPESILIVEDHRLLRDVLTMGLERQFESSRIDAAKDLSDSIEYLERRPKTDVILLDYRLPDSIGVNSIKKLRSKSRNSTIIILSAYINRDLLGELKMAGANSAITKNVSLQKLTDVIIKTLSGDSVFEAPKAVVRNRKVSDIYNLSKREMEAWSHLANGKRNSSIASIMNISESTVKVHLHNVFKKIGVHSRIEAYELWVSLQSMPFDED